MNTLSGQTLASRYTVESLIGHGGMADVYRGTDTVLQRPVAIKILTDRSDDIRKRFLREARAMAMLNHRNIVNVFDAGEFESISYIIMELIEGRTLADIPPTELTMRTATRFFVDLFDALSYAHEKDIVHRDVKPANIMLLRDGTLKVMDFGLSRRTTEMSMTSTHGEIVGTIAYLAPERFLGKPADARSDLYSVGIVMYEIFTGDVPFKSENEDIVSVIFAHANEAPVPPRTRNRNIPPQLEAIILKLLEKDPDRRYQSAKEVAGELRALLGPQAPQGARAAAPAGSQSVAAPTIAPPAANAPPPAPEVQDVLTKAFNQPPLNQAYADILSGMLALRKRDYAEATRALRSALGALKNRNDYEYSKTAVKYGMLLYQKNSDNVRLERRDLQEGIEALTEALPVLRGVKAQKELEEAERLLYALQRVATTYG